MSTTPFEQLWSGWHLRREIGSLFGSFDKSRWSLEAEIDEEAQHLTWDELNRNTEGFVYQLAWNSAINSEKAKYTAIRDIALTRGCKTALDYGCGIGNGVVTLALAGIDIVGAEVNSPCLNFLQARIDRFNLQNARIWDLEWGDMTGQFNLIICTEVFEHVKDPHKLAKKLVGLLDPQGVAILSWSFVPMTGHLPEHFHLQAPHPDQLLTMGFGKFMQDELEMSFKKYSWFNNMIWEKRKEIANV